MDKTVFKSKTFYFNLIMALLAIYPTTQALLAANVELFASVWSGLGIVLRFFTKDKVILLP